MGVNREECSRRQFFLVYHHNTFLNKIAAMLCDCLFLLTHGDNSKRLAHIFEFRELETWRCFSRCSNQLWSTTNHWLLECWIIIPHYGSFTSKLQSEVTAKSDPVNLIPLQLFTVTLLPPLIQVLPALPTAWMSEYTMECGLERIRQVIRSISIGNEGHTRTGDPNLKRNNGSTPHTFTWKLQSAKWDPVNRVPLQLSTVTLLPPLIQVLPALPTAWMSEYTMECGLERIRLYHQFQPTANE